MIIKIDSGNCKTYCQSSMLADDDIDIL